MKWITLKETSDIISLVDLLEARDYVSGYSIENEKYKKEKYSALITVTFEKNKLERFLENKNIEFFSKKGPKTLIIPIINFEKRLILWDDPNPWFDVWLRRPLDSTLNLFTLPTGEADDLITLSAQDAINLKYFKIKKLSNRIKRRNIYWLPRVNYGLTLSKIFCSFSTSCLLIPLTFFDSFKIVWDKLFINSFLLGEEQIKEVSNQIMIMRSIVKKNPGIVFWSYIDLKNNPGILEILSNQYFK